MKNLKEIKLMMERLESPRLTDTEYQERVKQLKEAAIRIDIGSHEDMKYYGKNTKWAPASEHGDSERFYNLYTEKYGPFTVFMNDDKSLKIACFDEGDCWNQMGTVMSREEAAQKLGYESLDDIGYNF